MELRHLRYFCAVAEELSMTRAAERLRIAQPPLTRQIKQLEEEIGAKLFNRKGRRLELAPAGRFFFEQARQLLDKANSAVRTTRHVAQMKRLVFGIGFVPSVFYGQLPDLVRRLRQNHDVEIVLIELVTLEQIQALKTGRIDIGFGRIRIDDPEIEQELLFDEPLLAALPYAHPLARTQPSLPQLAAVPLITFPNKPSPNFADIVLSLFRQRGLAVDTIQQVNDVQTALGLVAAEMGFTLVPEQVRRIKRDGIAFVQLQECDITSPILCSRRKESPSTLMLQVNEILRELVENRLTGRYP